MKKLLLTFLLCTIYFLLTDFSLASSTINSLEVIEDTFKGLSHCMHYKVIGMCYWLKCEGVDCHIEPTLKINQYLPDAVVSVYTKPSNNPWWFAQHIADPVFYQAGKAAIKVKTHFKLRYGDEHDNSPLDINNKFHEVDIIGNPSLSILSGYKIMLHSAAIPFRPYYSSLLDAYAWRFPALEHFYPGSFIPGLHEVGQLIIHDWGPVYPRNGYVNQPDDAKAAAVNALRASTIITAVGQPHLYQPLSNTCGGHCLADSVKENSQNAQYQMIYPKVENQCKVFGSSDLTSLHPWETDASTKGHNRYIWILWRRYHGCISDQGAKYLGSIHF